MVDQDRRYAEETLMFCRSGLAPGHRSRRALSQPPCLSGVDRIRDRQPDRVITDQKKQRARAFGWDDNRPVATITLLRKGENGDWQRRLSFLFGSQSSTIEITSYYAGDRHTFIQIVDPEKDLTLEPDDFPKLSRLIISSNAGFTWWSLKLEFAQEKES